MEKVDVLYKKLERRTKRFAKKKTAYIARTPGKSVSFFDTIKK